MLKAQSRKFSQGFEGQFHYGCFYAYLKLKEQEIKNVTWLAELVQMQVSKNLPGWNKYVTPFMYHLNDASHAMDWASLKKRWVIFLTRGKLKDIREKRTSLYKKSDYYSGVEK